MERATPAAVLGDFAAEPVIKDGIASSFKRQGEKFIVTTDGPGGALADFEIKYTFGFTPLQQYLVEFPGGRLQALPLAWDSRAKEAGGQRWFHLNPDQKIAAGDPLHWTGRNQNWNWMCADCHSTDLKRNYDATTDSYATTHAEPNVACEACHGPSSAHAADPTVRTPAFVVGAAGAWRFPNAGARTRQWTGAPRSDEQLDACAGCHARRRSLIDDQATNLALLARAAPALLDEGLYHADGQLLEEDYEYGSFVQSRMHRAGVTCSDCHEPHSGTLRAEGNALCGSCHEPAAFDTPLHHKHAAGGAGADCADCHMPNSTYMVIDERRDHSIRVPRPDLSAKHGTPNACTMCHTDQSARWAADAVVVWYGPQRRAEPHFVAALDAGRRGSADAEIALALLVADPAQPGIARATALALIAPYLTRSSFEVVATAARDADPLVRLGAVQAAAQAPPPARAQVLVPMLDDQVRAVRVVAARGLVGMPEQGLDARQRAKFEQGLAEWIATERAAAERPESHLNLSVMHAERGDAAAAERELRLALALEPRWVPALLNLADLLRATGRETEVEPLLQQAIAIAPAAAEPIHALGLLRVRQGRLPEALPLLRQAAELQPAGARFAFVYAIAQRSSGDARGAERTLERAHATRPADREVLLALVDIERARGARAEARAHAEQLVRLVPDDPGAQALFLELNK